MLTIRVTLEALHTMYRVGSLRSPVSETDCFDCEKRRTPNLTYDKETVYTFSIRAPCEIS